MFALNEAWFGLQTTEELQSSEGLLKNHAGRKCLLQLRHQLNQICDCLDIYVVARFQDFFRDDSEGVVRKWNEISTDMIAAIYSEAQQQAWRKEKKKTKQK